MPPTASLPQTSEFGVVEVRYWENLNIRSVSDLISLPAYPDNPDIVTVLNELQSQVNRGDNYGSLVRGFVVPPTTGTYQFFVTGDNETQFWLSTDETPGNAEMIALMPGAAAPGEFDKYNSQKSTPRELVADNRYYFEIRHVERSGGDHFAVSWEGPGISRQIIGGNSIASLGQSPYEQIGEASQEDIETAYALGYRVGFFDGTQGLQFGSQYPPLDMDQDGLYDNWEVYYGLDPNDPTDATSDQDNDLLTALDEFWLGASPTNSDTDGDGIPDGVEFANELDPTDPTDAQGDLDGDGATNLEEYRAGTGMNDATEVPAMAEAGTDYVSGFVGQYFLGTNFDQFEMTQVESDVDYRWGRGAPATGMPSDDFSIRWVGIFTAPHDSGQRQYLFQTVTDDGVRLYLDGELVINEWRGQGATPYSTTRTLDAGESVRITMEYFEGCCGATAQFVVLDLSTEEELPLAQVVSSPDPELAAEGVFDSDDDGIPDTWEVAYGLDPWNPDSANTVNNQGVSNLQAYQSGVSPWTLEPVETGEAVAATPEPEETAPPEPGEVTLSWTAPSTRVDGSTLLEADIQSYEVVYGQSPEAMTNVHTVPIGQTSTTITGLEPGIWYFSVRTIAESPGPLTDPIQYAVE
ncbi:PA14 domain-containing protein [Marinobacter daqiaonensis]|nr:PA14 domain-containing protein [Marinobacter daqiaonensis]